MKQKKLVSILCLILAALMVLSLVFSVMPIRAYAVSQADIDAVRAKKEEISRRVVEAQERLNGLESQQLNVLEQKAALEEQRDSALEALELVAEEIAMYDEMIEQKSRELQAAQTKEQAQLQRYRTRIRAMEENRGYNIIALLVNSTSFAELLTALDDMGEIMESDKELEHQYRAAREEVERVKAEYEQVRSECQEKQAELEEEKAGLESQISDVEIMLEALADQIAEAMQAYEAEAAAEEQAAAEVTALIAQYEEEQRRAREAAAAEAARRAAEQAAQNQGGNTGGAVSDGGNYSTGGSVSDGGNSGGGGASTSFSGGFGWPCPSWNGYITGRYGEQRSGHVHAGIDIDGYGCDGAAIVASAAGTVITATYSGGYGNYVLIDHGNGYQTLYAHLGGISVGAGAYVGAGQTIGTMGASGNATGTHCHFEIRINGNTADPEAWFPGLAHWGC